MTARLYGDVLMENFLYSKASYTAEMAPRCNRWITVAHVSRSWRYTALHSPALWSDIRINGTLSGYISFLYTSLKLSGKLLKRITVEHEGELPAYAAYAVVYYARAQAGRIEKLWIESEGDYNIHHHLTFPMPSLEILSLHAKIFLKLRSVYAPWKWAPQTLTRLTHLILNDFHPWTVPSYDEFLDMLQACHNLEFLYLGHSCFPIKEDDDTPREREIYLPSSLRDMYIYDEADQMAEPMDALKLSSNTRLHLIPSYGVGSSEHHIVHAGCTRLYNTPFTDMQSRTTMTSRPSEFGQPAIQQ
ncbi:hypothetical protein OBBRIDRAFT_509625 [Obba rivulosa]|uniref:F-box domain-containing protein n=1 Tax=Obba rivulosa TaxID=1052685 RepID=A0A8E2B0S0_9APHY|nr:hypothetical protein OBBRIDRAFT_509625 [Obba rivulosa]